MKLFKIPFSVLFFAYAFSTASAIDPKKIVGGKIHRTLPTHSSSYKASLPKKSTDMVSLYRGSKHERALDAQIRNYRESAKKNAEVFGREYRPSISSRLSSPSKSAMVTFNNKRFRLVAGEGGNLILIPLK